MEAWQKHGNHNNVYWIGLKETYQGKKNLIKENKWPKTDKDTFLFQFC